MRGVFGRKPFAALLTRYWALLWAACLVGCASTPADSILDRLDPDTATWWKTTAELSSDSMEGRDTGSAAYIIS